MNLPRWLVIAGIVIVVLGFLSCGIGIALDNEPEPSGRPAPRGDLDYIPASAVPAAEVATSPCSRNGTGIQFAGACTLTIQPSGFLPRELRLFVTTGSVTVRVTQEIRGEPRTSDPDTFAGATPGPTPKPHAKIRVSGSRVDVSLVCSLGTCRVLVIE